MPIDKFTRDDLWTDIEQCEQKGLIEVIFEHNLLQKELMDYLKSLFYESYPGDRYENEWRTFYEEILDRLLDKVLKTEFKKKARKLLRDRSHDYIINAVKDTFCKNYLMPPPYLFQKKS